MSTPRLNWYLREANGDLRLALRLHAWNAALGGSILPTVQLTEIAIRNFAVGRLRSKYGKRWYQDVTFERRLGRSSLAEDLHVLVGKLSAKGTQANLADHITSDLTFGFWVNVFTKTFYSDLWLAKLHTISSSMPRTMTIEELHEGVEFVRTFRNRIAHHKNLVRSQVGANLERTFEVLSWFCQDTASLARDMSTFEAVHGCDPRKTYSETTADEVQRAACVCPP